MSTPLCALPITIGVIGHHDADRTALEREEQAHGHLAKLFRWLKSTFPNTPIFLLSALNTEIDAFVRPIAQSAGIDTTFLHGEFARSEHEADLFTISHSQILLALWDGVGDTAESAALARRLTFQLHGRPPSLNETDQPLDPPIRGPVWHLITPRKEQTPPEKAGQIRPLVRASDLPGSESHPPIRWWVRLWRWLMASLFLRQRYLGNYARHLQHLETFNDEMLHNPRLAVELSVRQQGLATLGPVPSDADLNQPPPKPAPEEPPPHLVPTESPQQHHAVERTIAVFQVADLLSQSYQKWVRRAVMVAFLLAWVAAVFKVVNYKITNGGWTLVVWVLALLALGAVSFTLWLLSWRRKFQDYRALAEGLRVAIFWRLAGLWDCPADHYPRTLRRDLGWVRMALRGACLLADPWPAPPSSTPFYERLVRWCWINGQTRYFNRAAPANQRRHDWLWRWRCLLLTLGSLYLLWTLWDPTTTYFNTQLQSIHLPQIPFPSIPAPLKLAQDSIEINPNILSEHNLSVTLRSIDIVMGVGLFLAGSVLYAYGEMQGLRVHAERYRRMREVYGQAHRYFADPAWGGYDGSLEKAQKMFRELGCEALGENARWFREHRKRDAEQPPT